MFAVLIVLSFKITNTITLLLLSFYCIFNHCYSVKHPQTSLLKISVKLHLENGEADNPEQEKV